MEAPSKLDYIRFGNVFTELDHFSTISVIGSEALSFLNKQLTSKVESLQDSSFQQSCILDIKGRLVSNFLLLKVNNGLFFILVNKKFCETTIDRLNQFLVSEDVMCTQINKKFYAQWGVLEKSLNGFTGKLYNENCHITDEAPIEVERISEDDLALLQFCSGEPSLGDEIQPGDLVTNSFLTETSVAMNKGCYPGQETVNKVLSNKGASLFPVCLVSEKEYQDDEIVIEEKKIARILNRNKINNKYCYYATVNREHRVLGKKIDITTHVFEVHYFPLFSNSVESKSLELFYKGVEEFQRNHDQEAIRLFELAIELNPLHEDAYESLGVLCGRLGDYHKAIELMKKLEKVNPLSVMAHTNLSLYYMKIGQIETAEEHKSLATVKQFEVLGKEAQVKRDLEQKKLKDKEEQIRKEGMFQQVLEIDNEDALANYGMGEIEFQRGEYLKAQKYLEKALASDPRYSVAYLLLTKVLKASQKKDLLIQTIQKGIEVATKNGDLMPANEMQSILNELR